MTELDDRVHQCSHLYAPRSARRWECGCGQVWKRVTVEACGQAWPAWQRVAAVAPPIPGAAGRRQTTNTPGVVSGDPRDSPEALSASQGHAC